jgi:rhamnulokinase/L-fuculokinase
VRSFAQLEDEARQAKPFQAFINPDEDVLVTPGDIPARICRLCAQTGQYVPLTRGEIIRCIYESLALKYRASIENLEETTGKRFSKIHVIGGGAKDKLLNSFTAGACGRDVIAGPVEATVLGNVAVQLIVAGEIASLSQARQVVASSFDMNCCQPENTADWDIAYEGYIKIARTDKTII